MDAPTGMTELLMDFFSFFISQIDISTFFTSDLSS